MVCSMADEQIPSGQAWRVEYHRDLERELRSLPKPYIRRVLEVIESLASNPRPHGAEKLTGHDLWRIRIGVYRLLYQISEPEHSVRTYCIGHRRDVYRRLG
jgi:mRNA interferase RelE/StbE